MSKMQGIFVLASLHSNKKNRCLKFEDEGERLSLNACSKGWKSAGDLRD